MKETLEIIIAHTMPFGGILDNVLIIGTGSGKKSHVTVESYDEAGSIVLKAKSRKAIPEITSTFAIHRLPVLKGYFEFPSFNTEGSKVEIKTIERDDVEIPTEINFSSENKVTKASYRFKDARYAAQPQFDGKFKKTLETKILKQDVPEFEKLSKLIGSDYPLFAAEVDDDNNLTFILGGTKSSDDTSISLVKTDVEGSTREGVYYPINTFLSVVKVAGQREMTLSFIDNGAMVISIEDDIFTYDYYIMAKTPE